MDLAAIKASAEAVLSGSESSEAQQQAHNVLAILDARTEEIERHKAHIEEQDQQLAQHEAEKGDLEAQKGRVQTAEAEARDLGAELDALQKKYDALDKGLADRVEAAVDQLKEVLGGK